MFFTMFTRARPMTFSWARLIYLTPTRFVSVQDLPYTHGYPKFTINFCMYFLFLACIVYVLYTSGFWLMTNVMHKFFSMHLFLFINLYVFRAHRAYNQERQIVSIQPLVTVILYWWPRCVQVGRSLLPTCTQLSHQHRMTVTRGCIDKICLSWW